MGEAQEMLNNSRPYHLWVSFAQEWLPQRKSLFSAQRLQHTLTLEQAKWRVLDKCHNAIKLAEYEGHLEITTPAVKIVN